MKSCCEHYLSSSENKAWIKFRPVCNLNPWPQWYLYGTLPTIWFACIIIYSNLFTTLRVYWETTWCPVPSRLVSSIGGVLHQYGGGHGFKSCMGLNFFQALFLFYLSSVYNSEDCFYIHVFNCSSHIWFSYLYIHVSYWLLDNLSLLAL